MTTKSPSVGRERSFLEAGFFGLAVLFGVVAALMVAFVLGFSLLTGEHEIVSLTLGCLALAVSGGAWLLSRLAR